MNTSSPPLTNFAYLQAHDEQLVRLGMLAEKYFPADPTTCLLKLRQFAELLAQLLVDNCQVAKASPSLRIEKTNQLRLHVQTYG